MKQLAYQKGVAATKLTQTTYDVCDGIPMARCGKNRVTFAASGTSWGGTAIGAVTNATGAALLNTLNMWNSVLRSNPCPRTCRNRVGPFITGPFRLRKRVRRKVIKIAGFKFTIWVATCIISFDYIYYCLRGKKTLDAFLKESQTKRSKRPRRR